MKELTKERLTEIWSSGGGFLYMLNEAWEAIEADREAIHAQTREEVLKDHFKLGEDLDAWDGDRWNHVKVRLSMDSDPYLHFLGNEVRRPPKKRAVRPDEMVKAMLKAGWYPNLANSWHKLKDETITDLYQLSGGKMEIEE